MSGYSDAALEILRRKSGEGRFSGLNQFLDVQQAFRDAQQKYQFDQALAKQQGKNAGYASIINSSNINGVDPSNSLAQFNQAVDNNGVITQPKTATDIASGGTSTNNGVNPDVASITPTSTGFSVTPTSTPVQSNRNESALSNLTPERQALIKRIADYKENPATLSRGNAGRALAGQVSKYDPEFDSSQYAIRQSFMTGNWNKGPLFQSRQAAENLVQHAATFDQYQQALNNGDLKTANKLLNSFKNETGHSEVNNAATFARVIAVEQAKLLSPTGVLSDQQEREAASSVPVNASPQILHDAVRNVAKIAAPRINSALEKHKEVMGKYPNNAFSPEFWTALQKIDAETYNELAKKSGKNTIDVPMTKGGTTESGQGAGDNDPEYQKYLQLIGQK